MKRTNFNVPTKNTLWSILMAMTVFFFTSCTHKISFLTSAAAPAARGYVEIKKDKNKNNVIQVHLSNLAEVGRLTPPKQTYVVWMLTNDDVMKNIGQIKSSTNKLTKNLEASFETVSSFSPTKIIITAEDDENVQYPSSQVVLTTDRF